MHKTIDVLLIDPCDADSKRTAAAIRRAAPAASLVRVKDSEQALRLMFRKGLFTEAPHTPRLIVLELALHDARGTALLAHLRKQAIAPKIPVLVLTSTLDANDLRESYALGARECLIKPHDVDRYVSEVASAVERHLS